MKTPAPAQNHLHQPILIRRATSAEDRQRIFRFRYEVYVEEMGRPQKYADHAARTIVEPFDATGHLFLALEGDRIVGTARTNFGRDTDFGSYRELYGMDCVGAAFPNAVSVSTKLMVAPEHRGGTLGYRLIAHLYRFGVEQGIAFDFIDCNPHLEDVYQRLGYCRYRGRIQHEEYGDVLPLVMPVTDLAHLTAIRSPLARICRECPRRAEATDFRKSTVDRVAVDRVVPNAMTDGGSCSPNAMGKSFAAPPPDFCHRLGTRRSTARRSTARRSTAMRSTATHFPSADEEPQTLAA